MGFFKTLKEIVSPVPSFGNTGPIKFRSMSFGTTDSLKAYLDATYFEEKEVEYYDSYDEYYLKEFSKKITDINTLSYGTVIPNMTTGLSME